MSSIEISATTNALEQGNHLRFFLCTPHGAGITDADGRWLCFNEQLLNILGRSENDLRSEHLIDAIVAEQQAQDSTILSRVFSGELDSISIETQIQRKDGIISSISLSLFTLRCGINDSLTMGVQLLDITSRILTEEALRRNAFESRKNLEELEWIYLNAPVGLCQFDIDLRYKRINKFLAEINGLPPNAHIGKKIESVLPGVATSAEEVKDYILTNKRSYHHEFRRENPRDPDKTRFFDENWYPLIDQDNKIIGFGAVIEEITEKKHILALKEVDRRKNELLATLAHELRNPIGSVAAALEMIRMIDEADTSSVTKDRKYLERAERQINHMKRLVEDILTVARIQQGKIELKLEVIDIANIASQAIDVMQSKMDEKNISFTSELPPRPLHIKADSLRIIQVIINLLDNATKFTEPGGRISLLVKEEPNEVTIAVRDSGVGINTKELPHIFEIFNQIDASADKKNEGIGIGLALVKNIVEMHNGRVTANSEGKGRGSKFIISLPSEDISHAEF